MTDERSAKVSHNDVARGVRSITKRTAWLHYMAALVTPVGGDPEPEYFDCQALALGWLAGLPGSNFSAGFPGVVPWSANWFLLAAYIFLGKRRSSESMNQRIHIGDRGTAVGALRPTGRIRVGRQTFEATTRGTWIDADAEVVIIGGDTNRVVVCVASPSEEHQRGAPLSEPRKIEETPLQAPLAWVERFNFTICGGIAGLLLDFILWLRGVPMDFSALLVPLAGIVAGRLLKAFVGTAIRTVGPRADHRPRANGIAAFTFFGAALGSAIGSNSELAFIGVSGGLVFGVLMAGVIAYAVLLLSVL